ncbi:MAG TPA: uroporphyrinogen-III synthase, partial [Opitutaceae bacterium]|nr:uroporphyrinogen-III synthase [Opitutaceae bacterium]
MSTPAQPLAGKRVAVTRTREQASELALRLAALGAEVLELPVLRISKDIPKEILADAMLEFGSYDWLVFTSANGVRYFFEEFRRLFDDIRSLGLIRIACVGEGTARRIAELHLRVECQPATATAEALADALIDTGSLDSAKVLVVTGNLNRDALPQKLEAAGAIVDQLPVYRTDPVDLAENPAAADFRRGGADAVLFASSSSVDSYVLQGRALALEAGARKPLHGSIGPQTSAALKKHKLALDFEAEN